MNFTKLQLLCYPFAVQLLTRATDGRRTQLRGPVAKLVQRDALVGHTATHVRQPFEPNGAQSVAQSTPAARPVAVVLLGRLEFLCARLKYAASHIAYAGADADANAVGHAYATTTAAAHEQCGAECEHCCSQQSKSNESRVSGQFRSSIRAFVYANAVLIACDKRFQVGEQRFEPLETTATDGRYRAAMQHTASRFDQFDAIAEPPSAQHHDTAATVAPRQPEPKPADAAECATCIHSAIPQISFTGECRPPPLPPLLRHILHGLVL